MATVLDVLKRISAYPIPLHAFIEVAEVRGLVLTAEALQHVLVGRAYKLAKADLYIWLSTAPNITQGGQSYSFTDEQRQQLREQAQALYDECVEGIKVKPVYGYKGSRL